MKTMLDGIGTDVRVRRGGAIVHGDPRLRRTADSGAGARPAVGVPWSDVSTAWRSTSIGDIEVFFEVTRDIEAISRLPKVAAGSWRKAPSLHFLPRQVDRRLPPDPRTRSGQAAVRPILAEAWNATGQHVDSVLSLSPTT